MKRPLRRNRNVFRFKDLPQELRNHIYADAIDRVNPFDFPVSHRFNSGLPLLDHQVNREASAIMYAIPDLAFWIDSFQALIDLPLKLKKAAAMPDFKRCRLDFFLIKSKLLEGEDDSDLPDLRCLPYGKFKKALSLVAKQLTTMPNVEELEIGYLSTLPINGMDHKFWPDNLMDSFKGLRGFKEVSIKGDLEKSYAKQLTGLMRQPRETQKYRCRETHTDRESQDRTKNNFVLF